MAIVKADVALMRIAGDEVKAAQSLMLAVRYVVLLGIGKIF